MRHFVTLLVAVALFPAPALAQEADVSAVAGATVFFYSASPLGAGSLKSATTLGATVNEELGAELEGSTFVEVRLHSRGWIFEVSRLPARGQTVAQTQVKLGGGASALATVALDLNAALAGQRHMAVFTNGLRGIIVAVVPITAEAAMASGRQTVQAAGATHVELLVSGSSRTFRIVNLGATLDVITVAAVTAGPPGEQAEVEVDTLIEIILDLL